MRRLPTIAPMAGGGGNPCHLQQPTSHFVRIQYKSPLPIRLCACVLLHPHLIHMALWQVLGMTVEHMTPPPPLHSTWQEFH